MLISLCNARVVVQISCSVLISRLTSKNGWQNQPGKCDNCKPCNQFFLGSGCSFGDMCKFSHDERHVPLGEFAAGSVDTPCKHFLAGTCYSGEKCLFSHAGLKAEDTVQEVGFTGFGRPRK